MWFHQRALRDAGAVLQGRSTKPWIRQMSPVHQRSGADDERNAGMFQAPGHADYGNLWHERKLGSVDYKEQQTKSTDLIWDII